MRLISFCLYGSPVAGYDRKYLAGMAANIELAKTIYPGWSVRCYVDAPQPDLTCEQIVMGRSIGHAGMAWRLHAMADTSLECVLFRDADSRLNPREAAAVDVWLRGEAVAHSMHDHRHHVQHPLMGGMWGIRHGWRHFPDIAALIAEYQRHRSVEWIDDLRFLEQRVYLRIWKDVLHHCGLACHLPYVPYQMLTVELPQAGFVGQQFTAEGKGLNPV